jgi:DNA-binding NarL/FixJ family response regulator
MAAPERVKILIADDHQLIIDTLTLLLKDAPDMDVLEEANNGEEVMQILQRRKVDLVLMDIEMPELDGIEATKQIRAKYPDVKVMALSGTKEKKTITKMLDAGAAGFVLKNCTKDELISAIRKIARGSKYFSSDVSEALMDIMAESKEKQKSVTAIIQRDQLTPREIEIIKLLAEGMSSPDIAKKLFRSSRTIDTHRTNIMKKIGVHNIAGLIKYAIQNGIIEG